ncbi:hypothetical protein Cgig2_019344 [Carnegiea gigantea]|uniref:Small ribosomal subunit protein eS31 domain-containing protein n=1 Tax=Carnegiea gigantea TaxID=171969 RepID=A0A9Q1JIF7_9CARY|nr:hypothetical protein Cgig2_030131 [Carnegiea gigantea]KAJ8446451.1 hypothetical protein Cgig2_019344 [Carnegiea gigantea]
MVNEKAVLGKAWVQEVENDDSIRDWKDLQAVDGEGKHGTTDTISGYKDLKRKKKTYTKPKKLKHKKKKVKLAVLQFYKVDDSGKVQRLRKECPNAECGAGTFMANHFDRHYCGKCGLTYVYQKAGESKKTRKKDDLVKKPGHSEKSQGPVEKKPSGVEFSPARNP